MSDEKIIKFGKLQEKWNEQEVDKFEDFLNMMMEDVVTGNISISEFTAKMSKYQLDNNISNEKLMELQKKLLEKMGIDIDINDFNKQMEILEGLEKSGSNSDSDGENKNSFDTKKIKEIAFFDFYKDKITNKKIPEFHLKTEKNDLIMFMEEDKITIVTENKIDFADDELNAVITDYRECIHGSLKIVACEASKIYEYH
ncbi:MAG: DUF3867 family protein [Peptostreptococcus sp.]|uniref:DUF3867 family protein n=1 Tax=Peptostreptococcus sp. TaxID=1262 RepID=UPI002FCC5F25